MSNEQTREKFWQAQAGRLASIANWALVELLNCARPKSNVHDQAGEYLNQVIPILEFDDGEEEK
jgi:hypothetical protein